jgi:hypothetical protein
MTRQYPLDYAIPTMQPGGSRSAYISIACGIAPFVVAGLFVVLMKYAPTERSAIVEMLKLPIVGVYAMGAFFSVSGGLVTIFHRTHRNDRQLGMTAVLLGIIAISSILAFHAITPSPRRASPPIKLMLGVRPTSVSSK